MTPKIPYYVVKKGRGFWQPDRRLKDMGFVPTPCGPDGPRARELATRLADEASAAQRHGVGRNSLHRVLRKSFKNASERARKRGMDFSITFEAIFEMVTANDMRCAISGVRFSMEQKEGGHVRQPFAPSIDRISCSEGYAPGNVRVVLTAVNYAMNEWGDAVFYAIAKGASKVGREAKKRTRVGTFPTSTNSLELAGCTLSD